MARKKKEVKLTSIGLPADYPAFLESLKIRVQQTQMKSMLSVNRELIQLYWDIGELIVERQEQAGWGHSVIDLIPGDIQKAFPGIEGFSSSNISRMRAFFRAYRGIQEISAQPVPKLAEMKSAQPVPKLSAKKVPQTVRQLPESGPPPEVACLPWGHNVVLLFKLKDHTQRLWYAAKTLEHGLEPNHPDGTNRKRPVRTSSKCRYELFGHITQTAIGLGTTNIKRSVPLRLLDPAQ